MEVHTHSHTARKKWTHYFWEFLMLFLAVFCGFLAEYQLEHKIERDREKDYMKGMLEDLYEDTVSINNSYQLAKAVSNGIDSLKHHLYNTDVVKENVVAIYRLYGTYLRRFGIRFSDQTAIQLRNSGQMRLIRKRNVVKAMASYWQRGIRIGAIDERIEMIMNEVASFGDEIVNRKYLGEFGKRDSITAIGIVELLPGAELMTHDKNTLVTLANKIARLKRTIDSFYFVNISAQRHDAIRLINLIEKEYSIE